MKLTVNLLVTINRNYLMPLVTMLKSYILLHPNIPTDLYVAHSALSEADFKLLGQTAAGSAVCLHNVQITENYFQDIPLLERIPAESFYRLLAFDILPEEAERCLYLDPDILIRHSLLPFYEMELGTSYAAACAHLHGFRNLMNKARLGLREPERYVNSGVLLMNLKEIRRDFDLQKILSCLKQNQRRLFLGDQDLVNILFGEKMILADEKIYNLDERTLRYEEKKHQLSLDFVEEKTAIIHYNGRYKPWLSDYKGELDFFYPEVREKGEAPKGVIGRQIKSVCQIIFTRSQ